MTPRRSPQAIDDVERTPTSRSRLDLPEYDVGRVPRVDGVADDGAHLGQISDTLDPDSPRGRQDLRRFLDAKEDARHPDRVVRLREAVHGGVVWVEPVR